MIDEKEVKENYVSMKEAANIIGVSVSRISRLCTQGRFEGAIKLGWSWLIPKPSAQFFERRSRGKKSPKSPQEIFQEFRESIKER